MTTRFLGGTSSRTKPEKSQQHGREEDREKRRSESATTWEKKSTQGLQFCQQHLVIVAFGKLSEGSSDAPRAHVFSSSPCPVQAHIPTYMYVCVYTCLHHGGALSSVEGI